MMAINGVTTTIVNDILSCLHSNARFIRGKSWKISLFPKPVGEIAKTSILPTTCFKQFLCSSRFSLHVWKVTQLCVCCELEFWTGRRVCHHRHIAFLAVIEDAPLLTKTVKINQSEGIPGSGIPECTPAPLSPVPLYFSSLSSLRTALHYLNAWNRLAWRLQGEGEQGEVFWGAFHLVKIFGFPVRR